MTHKKAYNKVKMLKKMSGTQPQTSHNSNPQQPQGSGVPNTPPQRLTADMLQTSSGPGPQTQTQGRRT